METFLIFLGKQTNVIDDASQFVNDVQVATVFVINPYRRKIGVLFAVFPTSQKALKIY